MLLIFSVENYKPNDPNFPLEKIKGMDPGMLPPCKDVLLQKLKRCNFVTYFWKHANLKNPLGNIHPAENGYRDDKDIFKMIWYTGSQIPSILFDTMESKDIINVDEPNDIEDNEIITDFDYDGYSSDEDDDE